MSIFNADVIAATAVAQEAFEATQAIINDMSEGQRIQIKDLAKSVGQTLSVPAKEVLGFVSHFVRNTKSAYVTRGKNGGVVKGTKPVKVVKLTKKQKAVDATSTIDSTAS